MRRSLITIALGALATTSCLAGEGPLSETIIADVPRFIERLQAGPYGEIWRHPDIAPVRTLVEAQIDTWFAERKLDRAAVLADLRSVVARGSPTTVIAPGAAGGLVALRLPTRAAEVHQVLDGAELSFGGGPGAVVHRDDWVMVGTGAQQAPAITIPAAARQFDTYGVLDWSAVLAHPETPPEVAAVMRAVGLRSIEQRVRLDQQGTREEMILPGFKPPLMTYDPQVLVALPPGQLLVGAFGVDGVQLATLLGGLGAELPSFAKAIADWDRPAKREGFATLDVLLRGWKGTVWFSVAQAAPFPMVTVGVPASAELDQLLTILSTTGKVDLSAAKQEAVVIPMPPSVPFLLQVRRTATHWVASTDQRVMDALASGTPGGFVLPALPAAGTTVGFYTQDTAGILRAGLGYLPLIMQGMPGVAAGEAGGSTRAMVAMSVKAVNAMLPHLQPTVANMQQDAAGARVDGTNLTVGSFPLGILAGAMLPTIVQVRELARRSQSGKNMSQIFGAMIAWQTEKDKWPPPSFEQLAKDMSIPKKLFESPNDPTHPSPYLFITPIADPPAAQPVLIEDPVCYRNQGTMVCFGDAHVKWIKAPAALRLWQEAKRLVALPKATMGGLELSDWEAVNDILGLAPREKTRDGGPSPSVP